ncbi:MAG: hypothetical protein Q8Q06_04450 [bacterium]|nr:hypothetical protein [bacterium]
MQDQETENTEKLIGHYHDGGRIIIRNDEAKNLEDWLLRQVGFFKRFLAKYLYLVPFVGRFSEAESLKDTRYYLIFCRVCERFCVGRTSGYFEIIHCSFCSPIHSDNLDIGYNELQELSRIFPASPHETKVLFRLTPN